jgi:hypothetical protein
MSKHARPLHVETPGDSAQTEAPAEAPTESLILPPDGDDAPLVAGIAQIVQPVILNAPAPGLPDQSQVDPKTIKVNTLTKQGWVIPEVAQAQANG